MIKLSNKKLIFTGFFMIVGLLLYLAIESYKSLLQYKVVNADVLHAQLVILENAQMLSYIKDAETGQRGYLLTGQAVFLNPYNVSKANYRKQVLQIKNLTSDNEIQQVRIDSISHLVISRLKLLDSGITIKSNMGSNYITPITMLNDGRKLMDTIGNLSRAINKEEELILKERQQSSFNNTFKTQNLFYLCIFFTIALFTLVFYYLLRQINKNRQAQIELYNRNEWFTQTLTSLGDGVVATSADHAITFMNKAAERLTLYKYDDVKLLPIETVIKIKNEITQLPVVVPTRKAIDENCVAEIESNTILTRKDGTEFYIDDSAAPVYDMNGKLLGAVLIFRDITEKSVAIKKLAQLKDELEIKVEERTRELNNEISIRRKAEGEKTRLIKHLVEINQSLEQFIYIISHNFRRPVANILGLLELYEGELPANFKNETLGYLTNEVYHLDMVLKDLGAITTIRKNQSENKELVSLRTQIDVIVESLEYEVNKVNAQIITNVGSNDFVFCIKTYLNSILLNLINNAIKYKFPDRALVITLDFKPDDQYDIIIVTDNGLGIDLEKNGDKVFGLYNRFHEHIEGKGLGLHISKTQMEMMGGLIKVQSTPGVGTSFFMYFPKGKTELN